MFYKLVFRGSRRTRKENGLFFSSLLISIIAFYILLSLSHQDIMVFLTKMESNAVDHLLSLIPVFYGFALFVLFFLIYYASKYQLQRRRHEFGVYLMLGMRRSRLFLMLLTEDVTGSISALIVGLPAAFLLSEFISLITARLVGIGIVGHRMSFSPQAAALTAAGFLLIKLLAFLILSSRISRQQIDSLLAETPEAAKKTLPAPVYLLSMLAGILCLGMAYRMAIRGDSWTGLDAMGLTLALGMLGTFAFLYGLGIPIGLAARLGNDRLRMFNVRQIQETIIRRFGTLAVCSLLILSALCCLGAGISIAYFYGGSQPHVLDYTFSGDESAAGAAGIRKTLHAGKLDDSFGELFEMKIGYIPIKDGFDLNVDSQLQMESVMSALRALPSSEECDVLLNQLSYVNHPHLISLDSYNALLRAAGTPVLELGEDEAAVYMDSEFASETRKELLNEILKTRPLTVLDGHDCYLTRTVQTTNPVTDRSITLSFALIVPDEVFERYTAGDYSVYLNGILAEHETAGGSLMNAIADMNEKLDQTGLSYESYLQNIGRQLFYMVAASYITIYLAIIFLIIANTIVGVQFLMGQQKASGRYRTLINLGATYKTLCRSAKRQINWYFGIPAMVAACSSLFGIRALFTGMLPTRAAENRSAMMIVSAAVILVMCVIEYLYILAVKRSSDRYLLSLMVPKREE